MGSFRIVIFTRKGPRTIARLATRINREVSGVRVVGILRELETPKPFSKRLSLFCKNVRDPEYIPFAARRALELLSRPLVRLGEALLRFAHACPAHPNGHRHFGEKELAAFAKDTDCQIKITHDMHSPGALDFIRELQADLGILYGTRILKPALYTIPKLGSINLHKRKVPDYRGGGAVGLWEMLDGQKEIGVTVHRVEATLDTGAVLRSATIPIGRYDTLTSLAMKAGVMGDDLYVAAIGDLSRGNPQEKIQTGPSKLFKNPKAYHMARHEKELRRQRPPFRATRGRPTWKLLLRTLLLSPPAICRNWIRRFRKSFPVVILYHHVVTDQLHHLGMPTEAFRKEVEFLAKYYRIASMAEALEMLRANRVDAPTVVLTLDDGYKENFINLRAVAEEADVPFTLFICTQNVAERRPFAHDLRKEETGFAPLTWEEIRMMSENSFEFGTHTRNHFDCGSTDAVALQDEIVGSKLEYEKHMGTSPQYFSFPFGLRTNISPQALTIAQETYPFVFSAYGGVNHAGKMEARAHLLRESHIADRWEAELLLQSILEFH